MENVEYHSVEPIEYLNKSLMLFLMSYSLVRREKKASNKPEKNKKGIKRMWINVLFIR